MFRQRFSAAAGCIGRTTTGPILALSIVTLSLARAGGIAGSAGGGHSRTPGAPVYMAQAGGDAAPAVEGKNFRIASPKDGDSVRGKVVIKVPNGTVPEGGYVSFALDDPANFKYATVASAGEGVFSWTWDTTESKSNGRTRIYPDRNYTVYAVAHDAQGKELPDGQAQVVVKVDNTVTAPGTIHLAYRLPVGEQQRYEAEYTLYPDVTGAPFIPHVRGRLLWDVHVDDFDPEDQLALLNATFQNVAAEDTQVMTSGRLTMAYSSTMFGTMWEGRNATMMLSDSGRLYMRGRRGSYEWARNGFVTNVYVKLPDQDVNVGDHWEGPVMFWTVGNPQHATSLERASNTLESVEYYNGVKAAKIRTTYSTGLPLQWQLNERDATYAAVPVYDPFGRGIGARGSADSGGASADSGGGGGGGGGKVSKKKPKKIDYGKVDGDRLTWIDLDTGRVLHVEDTRTINNLPKIFAQDNKGAGGGSSGSSGGSGGGSSGGGSSGGSSQADMSWLTGFDLTNDAATLAAMSQAQGASGGGGGYPGGGGGGYPGGGGGYPSGGMMGGYPGGGLLGGLFGGAGGGSSQGEQPPPPYKETLVVNYIPSSGTTDLLAGFGAPRTQAPIFEHATNKPVGSGPVPPAPVAPAPGG